MTTQEQNIPIDITPLKPGEPWRLLSLRAKEQDEKMRAGFEAIRKLKETQKYPSDLSAIDAKATLDAFDGQIRELEELLAKTVREAEEKRAQKAADKKSPPETSQRAGASDEQGDTPAESAAGARDNSEGENGQENNQQENSSNDLSAIDAKATLDAFDGQIRELEELLAKTVREAEEKRAQKAADKKSPPETSQRAGASDEQGDTPAESAAGARDNSEGENGQENNQQENSSNLELQLAEAELASAESDFDRRCIIYRRVGRDRDGYFFQRMRDSAPMYDVDAPPPLTPEDHIEDIADVVAEVYKRYTNNLESKKSEAIEVFHLSAVTVDLLIRYKKVFSEDTTKKITKAQSEAVDATEQQRERAQQEWEQNMGLSPASEAEEDEEGDTDAEQVPDIPEADVVALLTRIREERVRYVQEVTTLLEGIRETVEATLALPVSHAQVRTHTGFTGENFFGHIHVPLSKSGDAHVLLSLREELSQAEEALEDLKRRQKRFNVGRIEELVRQYGRESTLLGKLALKADRTKGASMLHLGKRFEDARRQAIADMVVILEEEGDIDKSWLQDEKNEEAEGVLHSPHDLIARAKQLGDEDTGRRSQHVRDIQTRRELVAHLEACEEWADELRAILEECDRIYAEVEASNEPPSSFEGYEWGLNNQQDGGTPTQDDAEATERSVELSNQKKTVLKNIIALCGSKSFEEIGRQVPRDWYEEDEGSALSDGTRPQEALWNFVAYINEPADSVKHVGALMAIINLADQHNMRGNDMSLIYIQYLEGLLKVLKVNIDPYSAKIDDDEALKEWLGKVYDYFYDTQADDYKHVYKHVVQYIYNLSMVEQSVGEMLRDSYTAEARSNFDNIRRLGQDRYDSILYGAYNFAEKENPDTSPDGFSHNPSFNYDMVEGDMQNAINTLTVMGLPHLVFDLKRKYLHVLVWHIKAQRREEKTEGRTESVSGPSEYKPETDMPPWVQERLNEAMQQLGLSDDSKLKAVLTVLTELGWKGTEAEEQVVSQIRDLAQQLNIPIMADTVVGFCELLLGLFDTRHGPTVEERFNILKPHLGDWIKHNLLATADLLPLLKGAKVAAVAATLLKTLGNNGEESTGGATIQWNVLTREAIKLVLDQMAERTSSDTSGGKLAQAVVGVLSELLEKDVSVFDATVRELSADQSVQQGLRNLAAGLQEPSEGGTDSAEGN